MNEKWRAFAREQYLTHYGKRSVVNNKELDALFLKHNALSDLLYAMRTYFDPTYEVAFVLPPSKTGAVYCLDRMCAVAWHFNLKGDALRNKLAQLEAEETARGNITMASPSDSECVADKTHSFSGRSCFLD